MRAGSSSLLVALVVLVTLWSPAVQSSLLPPALEGLGAEAIAQRTKNALRPLLTDTPAAAFWRLASLANVTVENETIAPATPDWLASAPTALLAPLSVLWGGIVMAESRVNQSLAGLNQSERDELRTTFKDVQNIINQRRHTGNNESQNHSLARYTHLVEKIDLGRMAQAELALLRSAQQAIPMLELVSLPSVSSLCIPGAEVAWEAENCFVIVGDETNTAYSGDKDFYLVVDLGGSDIYGNNAGGASPLQGSVAAIAIDLGNGNDLYHAAGSRVAVQGAGCLGAGLLIDMGGSDTYRAENTGKCLEAVAASAQANQGTGFAGAGVLVDFCSDGSLSCNDSYTSQDVAQGVGAQGFGLLLDEDGADNYTILHSFDSDVLQGVGCQGGFGAMIDREKTLNGDQDIYDAYQVDAQGFGCFGALGILINEDGDDTYLLRKGSGRINDANVVIESGLGQGTGEAATGILWDLAGNDIYYVEFSTDLIYTGWAVQGTSNAAAYGMLLDDEGNDQYTARYEAQGASSILRDEQGDDAYFALSRCQGTGVGGSLLNLAGDDSYSCNTPAFACSDPTQPVQRDDGVCWVSNEGTGWDYPG